MPHHATEVARSLELKQRYHPPEWMVFAQCHLQPLDATEVLAALGELLELATYFDSQFFVLNHLHQAGRESSRVKSVQSRYSKCDGYDGLFCLRWEMMGDDSAETPGATRA